jgi:hypothetical protein
MQAAPRRPQVAKDKEYLAFDEWWGPVSDNMPAIIGREVAAGRLRAYTSGADRRWWMRDDYIYNGAAESADRGSDTSSDRWWMRVYDDTIAVTWRRGVLWAGSGIDPATGALLDGSAFEQAGQHQLAVLHLLGSKLRSTLRHLEPTDHLRRLAAHALEIRVSRHGLFFKVSRTAAARAARAARAAAARTACGRI